MAFVGFIVHFFLLSSSILQQQKTEVDSQGRGLETKSHKVGEDWKNMEEHGSNAPKRSKSHKKSRIRINVELYVQKV